MTEEEIKKLTPPLCCGIHEELVARLLEERKRLLEALHLQFCGKMSCDSISCSGSIAAIRYAEGPTCGP